MTKRLVELAFTKWDKVFRNGPMKSCGRHPLKNFSWSILEYFVSNVPVSSNAKACQLMKRNCLGLKNI